ncbi:MAG TPA: biosynthetic peptidoglycan transglycosylase [Kofleriaceae bacterium]|nr:biosynthetic peptidoglycan transglycosylase [Kofleriaceae bacterium]
MRIRERQLLAGTCALALGVPLVLAHVLDRQVQGRLAPALSRATGQPVALGGVEAELTGAVRLRDVVVGDLLRADAIEAAVSLDSILAGELAPDEIRVRHPRVRAHIAADGSSDWQTMIAHTAEHVGARRTAAPASRSGGAGRKLRRIVVSGGDLVADLGGARIAVRDVELHPQAGGVRVVTGTARLTGAIGPYRVDGKIARAGADVALPRMQIERVVAVGGKAAVTSADARLSAAALDIVRDRAGGPWRITAEVDDRGAPRRVELAFTRTGGAGGAAAATVTGDRLPLAVLASLAPAGIALERAHASGTATIARGAGHGAPTLVQADLMIDGAWIDHRAIAATPVPLDGAVTLDLTAGDGRIDARTVRLARGGIDLTAAGWVRYTGRRVVATDATLTLAPGDCRALIDAIPSPLRGPLDELVVRGTLAGRGHIAFALDEQSSEGVDLTLDLDPRTCEVIADSPAADPRTLASAAEHTFPDGHRVMVGPGIGDWVELADLPNHVRGAFVAAEDARFWEHHGFDLDQIARSLEVDLREHRFARGGSTISQQLVKNAFLDQRRTLTRKLQEAVLTWRTEATLDKRTILGRYLNVIELGPGVFGVGAAARHWFGKPAGKLTVREAAFLAALTPAPRTMSARLARHHGLDPETAERVAVTLRAMRRAGVIDPETARIAAGAGLDFRSAAVGR